MELILNNPSWLKKTLYLIVACLIVVFITSPLSLEAFAGMGGYISEKLLGNGIGEDLYLGNGISEHLILGSVPVISTGGVDNTAFPKTGATADLHGTITSLNSMPSADIWFTWGYTATTLNHTTAVTTGAGVGDNSITITGFNPAQRIWYKFYASTDGITSGETMSFVMGDGRSAAMYLVWNILTLIVAIIIFIVVFKMSTNPVLALIGTIIGIVAIVIIRAVIGSML